MAQIPFYVWAGLIVLVVAFAAAFAYRYLVRANAKRRMRSMFEAVGIDPAIIDNDDLGQTIAEMRARCAHCSSKRHCEHWLEGDTGGGNAFCPNRELFGMLRRYSWYSS